MWFSKFMNEKLESVKRFWMPFIWTVFGFVIACIYICRDWGMFSYDAASGSSGGEWVITLGMIALFGGFLSILAQQKREWLEERFEISIPWLPLISLVSFALYPWFRMHNNPFVTMEFAGLIGIAIALIFWFIVRRDKSKGITQFLKSCFFAGLISGIVLVGVFICIWAVQSLIWDFANPYKAYGVAAAFVFIIIGINFTLSGIGSYEKEMEPTHKIFKGILYVAFTIYAALVAILVIYYIKILVMWQMPINSLARFGNIAVIFTIFFVFVMKQFKDENKIVNFFERFIGYLLIVILAMNFWSMGLRVNEYGLTALRYISLAFSEVALVFAIMALVRKGYIWIFMVAAATVLIITCTPLNIINMPFQSQRAGLVKVLEANNMIDDNGMIVPNSNISDTDKQKINDKWDAIESSPKMDSDKWAAYKYRGTDQVFGFVYNVWYDGTVDIGNYPKSVYYYGSEDTFDVTGYSTMTRYEKNGVVDGMGDYFMGLYQQWGDWADGPIGQLEYTMPNGDVLIIESINGSIWPANGTAEVNGVTGWLLSK